MWIQISSGKGPEECELAVSLFFDSFLRECNEKGIELIIVEAIPGFNSNSYKSILLSVEGIVSANQIGNINGTILWTCKSPLRPNHKRKNWFIDVVVYNEPESSEFCERDVKFETMRSSGPGGQNVNKVETAVRVIHLPTGLTVVANEERTQYMNKKLALARLAKLIEVENQRSIMVVKKTMWDQHNVLVRGNPVRVYWGEDFRLKSRSLKLC